MLQEDTIGSDTVCNEGTSRYGDSKADFLTKALPAETHKVLRPHTAFASHNDVKLSGVVRIEGRSIDERR